MRKTFFAILNLLPIFVLAQEKPNIVFILADDFGYGSLNCYGASKDLVRTPHIDRLAENGVRFTNAYTTSSVSSPTRYSLITGSYPWRSSLKSGVVAPTGKLLIDVDQVTIADLLKEQGYNTAAIGKWHLGYGNESVKDLTVRSPGPLDLGFDYHFGVPHNHDDIWGVYIENDHILGLRSKKRSSYSKNSYGKPYMGFDAPQRVNKNDINVITDKAIEWLKTQTKDTPFFLYFASTAVHEPSTPSDFMRGVSNAGSYGDYIQDLDRSVGHILESLEYLGLNENTLIIFTSDNGGDIPKNILSPEQYAIRCGLKINGSLRGDKHSIWEGGCRVPFIISWPEKIEKNLVSDHLISMTDVFMTLGDILNVTVPKDKNVAPDSFSFYSSLFPEKKIKERSSLVIADVDGRLAICTKEWKYIDNVFPESRKTNQKKEKYLYNLIKDIGETKDVLKENSVVANKLAEELRNIRNNKSSRL